MHGDFWPGNVLIDSAGACHATESGAGDEGVRVTGVVDWENAHAAGLPDVDLMHWWLATRPVELGAAVRQALADPGAVRRGLAELSISLPNPQIALEHVVLLTWLGHVTAGMDRTSADHLGRVWLARNVKPILQLLAGSEPVGPDPVGPRVERDLVTAPAWHTDRSPSGPGSAPNQLS